MNISFIVATTGLAYLDYCLHSLMSFNPYEIIVVIDEIGMKLTGCSDPTERIVSIAPKAIILYNTGKPTWDIVNQNYNIGYEAATAEWVVHTHDDTIWTKHDYMQFCKGAKYVDQTNNPNLVGVSVTENNLTVAGMHQTDKWPCPNIETACYTNVTNCCALGIKKSFWEEIGGFDVTDGIWFDAHLGGELIVRNKFILHIPTNPGVLHFATKAFTAHKWADGWKLAPKWHNCAVAYQKRYNSEFVRQDELIPVPSLPQEEMEVLNAIC